MGSINRYIVRTTLGAFLVVLVSLTAVIWVTQALRDIDLVTTQGQTLMVFVGITGLIIPTLMLVIAPIALLIALVHVLNKLSTDSEIVVMNAAGMSPWFLFRAFLSAAIVVSIFVAIFSAFVAPKGLRTLHRWLTEVRANVVANIVQPGRFTNLENGVTIHIRERRNNGQLLGILIDDWRNQNERLTIIAETGELHENDGGMFLILSNGSVQRHEIAQRDPTMVVFDRYAFDLSRFSGSQQAVRFSIREYYLWQLLLPSADDKIYRERPGEFRAELFDRLIAPFYPIAFVVVACAYLGMPRTARQSRTMSIVGAVGAVVLLRLIGFASTVFGVAIPWALSLQFIAVGVAIAAGLYVISRGIVIEPPAFISNQVALLTERLSRRFAPQ